MFELSPPAFSGIIGVARRDITPPIGIYNRAWGAAKHDVAEGVHRPLTLTAITFQQSRKQQPLVLISADLGWWKSKDDELLVRAGILDEFSLPPRQRPFLPHPHPLRPKPRLRRPR